MHSGEAPHSGKHLKLLQPIDFVIPAANIGKLDGITLVILQVLIATFRFLGALLLGIGSMMVSRFCNVFCLNCPPFCELRRSTEIRRISNKLDTVKLHLVWSETYLDSRWEDLGAVGFDEAQLLVGPPPACALQQLHRCRWVRLFPTSLNKSTHNSFGKILVCRWVRLLPQA